MSDVRRADQALVARGLAPSRTAAQRLIDAGCVFRAGDAVPLKKASQWVADADTLELRTASDATGAVSDGPGAARYVSRGGLKLAGALAHTGMAVAGRLALDVGMSTGGFADCLLQAGAARVVGIDVGHGQLHARLAADARITLLEGVNARHLTRADLDRRLAAVGAAPLPAAGVELIVGDVSFISLTLVLPALASLLAPAGELLMLVKPQFEVGREHVGKGGIVRDAAQYAQVETKIRQACGSVALSVTDYFDSPIAGGDGNREFFIRACRRAVASGTSSC